MSRVTLELPAEVEAHARREARRAKKTLSAYIAGLLVPAATGSPKLLQLAGSMPGFSVPDDADLAPPDEA